MGLYHAFCCAACMQYMQCKKFPQCTFTTQKMLLLNIYMTVTDASPFCAVPGIFPAFVFIGSFLFPKSTQLFSQIVSWIENSSLLSLASSSFKRFAQVPCPQQTSHREQ